MSDGKSLPLPVINEVTAPFWEGCRKHVFLLQRCSGCRAYRYRPESYCPKCNSASFTWEQSTGKGTVYTYTVTHNPFHPGLLGKLPLATVLVKLEEGVMVTSNVVDATPEEIAIGMPVEVCFEDVTSEITLPKFRKRRGAV